MAASEPTSTLPKKARAHLANVTANLQLVADMGYGDVALAVARSDGRLSVVADARPNTALAPFASSRVGNTLDREDEPEAYDAFRTGEQVSDDRRRVARGIKYSTAAWPIGRPKPYAVIVRDLAETVVESSGAMERAFMDVA
jgi:hypothetical protein